MENIQPLVSIGLPTYNRPESLKIVLESLLNQTYKNIEIIVSDNGSENPEVEKIVNEFVRTDNQKRIRYFRHPENKGPAFNFQFVLDQARGKYFLWNADDDIRSNDFIEVNTQFLESNPDYPASTSPNALVQDFEEENKQFVTFSFEGNRYERYQQFFRKALSTQGIFYSQYRTDIMKQCPHVGRYFIAADWAIVLYILYHGPIARLDKGYILNLRGGFSESSQHFRNFRESVIDDLNPMYRFYSETKDLYKPLTYLQRVRIFYYIMSFNSIYIQYLYYNSRQHLVQSLGKVYRVFFKKK